jgi:2-desacetyl-2-hydroxyethyl bacteriochlorophyllide A dehydrogenase
MQAVVMDAPLTMCIRNQPSPKPGPGEVLVQVRAVGICAGDLYIYRGINPYTAYPIIGGHEIAGIVVKAGDEVVDWLEGTRVVVEPFISCGNCYACRIGKSNCCANLSIIGVHRPGGFAEYVVAPATHLHVIPENLSFLWGSFVEPVTIGVQACRRGQVGEIEAGEYCLVMGCGPIGLALIEVARSRGARVVATDIVPDRLEIARQLGAETLLSDETLLTHVLEQTKGEGAPVILEATGSVAAVESTPALVAPGGRIVLVGLIKRGIDVSFPGLEFTRKEMTILGSRTEVNGFPEALELLSSGKIAYPSVAEAFSLWDAPDVFSELNENPGKRTKGVFINE